MEHKNGLVVKLFADAKRFLRNAKERIRETEIEDGFYKDHKPVREAAQTAYLATRFAVQGLAALQGVPENELPQDMYDCELYLAKHPVRNGKVKKAFKTAYQLLHAQAHYQGVTNVITFKMGFENARFVIEKLSGFGIRG